MSLFDFFRPDGRSSSEYQGTSGRFDMQRTPGQSTGILSWLRQIAGGWPGARYAPGTRADRQLREEKAHAGPRDIQLPAFLPYFDDHTQETAEMRQWYRVMLREPFVKAAFCDKVFDIEGLELHVNPYEDDSEDAEELSPKQVRRNRQAASFCQYVLTKRVCGGVAGLVWAIFSGGLVDGYSISEKVRALEERGRWSGKYVLADLKPKDTDNDVILEVDEFRNITAIMGLRYNAGEFFSPADFVIFEHLKFYSKPGGMSDFRAAYANFWMLDTVLKLRMIGCEKRAMPIPWGTWRDQAQRPDLEKALGLLKSANWIATPDSVKIQALEMAGTSHEIFRQSIESLEKRIVVSISGAYLQMMEGSPGDTRGDTSEHQTTADRVKGHLRTSFLEIVNKQIIPELCDLNFAGADYPEAVQGGVDEHELQVSAQVDKLLQELGLPLSKRAAYKKYARQAPLGPDDELKPVQAPVPGGGGGGPPEFEEDGTSEASKRLFGRYDELAKKHGRRAARAVVMAAAELVGSESEG